MSLRRNMQTRSNKKSQANAANRQDIEGNVSLWFGKEGSPVAYNGNMIFGDYKSDDCVHYNVVLFQPYDEDNDDKPYLYGGIVTIPNENKRSKKREQKIGRIFLYEGSHGTGYLMIYLGMDEDEVETFNCPLKYNDNPNPKSPEYIGYVYRSQDKEEKREDKQRVAKGAAVLSRGKRSKPDDWYGPEDIFKIVKTYNEEQVLDLFYLLLDHWFGDYEGLIKFCEQEQKSKWEEEKDEQKGQLNRGEFEYTVEKDDYEYPSEEEEEEEVIEEDEEVDNDDDEIDGGTLPTLDFSSNRPPRKRISEIANDRTKKTFKRVTSSFLQDIDDTDPQEIF